MIGQTIGNAVAGGIAKSIENAKRGGSGSGTVEKGFTAKFIDDDIGAGGATQDPTHFAQDLFFEGRISGDQLAYLTEHPEAAEALLSGRIGQGEFFEHLEGAIFRSRISSLDALRIREGVRPEMIEGAVVRGLAYPGAILLAPEDYEAGNVSLTVEGALRRNAIPFVAPLTEWEGRMGVAYGFLDDWTNLEDVNYFGTRRMALGGHRMFNPDNEIYVGRYGSRDAVYWSGVGEYSLGALEFVGAAEGAGALFRLGGAAGLGGTRAFRSGEDVAHFDRHGQSIARVLGRENYTVSGYVDDANWVVGTGAFSPELNAYVRFVGGVGQAKAVVVGLDRATGNLTTMHLKPISFIEQRAPSLGWSAQSPTSRTNLVGDNVARGYRWPYE